MMYFNLGMALMSPFCGMNNYQRYYTGQPDLGIWSMSPYRLMGTFAGRVQFSSYPTDYTMQDVIGSNNADRLSYYNNYFLNSFLSALNPASAIQQTRLNNQAAEKGYQMGSQMGFSINFNSTNTSVASLKYQLEQAINSSNISNEHKAQLELLKKQAEALEQRLERLAAAVNNGTKSVEDAQAELRGITTSCSELSRLKDEVMQAISAQAAETSTPETSTPETSTPETSTPETSTPETSTPETSTPATSTPETSTPETSTPETSTPETSTPETQNPQLTTNSTEAPEEIEDEELDSNRISMDSIKDIRPVSGMTNVIAAGVDDPDVVEIANKLYQLVDGVFTGGSDSEVRDFIKENINKENVVEVILYWNNCYAAKYKENDPHGIMESILDEFMMSDYQEATEPIISALKERLKDYQGIDASLYSEASSQLAMAEKANSKGFFLFRKIDVAIATNKAHKAIVELMKKQAGVE